MLSKRCAGGFTLVEVMVALAVVAVALPALMMSMYQQVDGTAHLRDKSLANMVAANKLSELRLQGAAEGRFLQGKDSGITELADRQWYWWLQSTPTLELEAYHRFEIKVAAREDGADRPLITLVTFFFVDPQAGGQ